jgi:predicted alpha/beta hydrolase family esterase
MTKKVLLVHGFNTNAQSNYFPELKRQLEKKAVVLAPDLPNPQNPIQSQWLALLASTNQRRFDLIFAHSLGCKAVLEFIQQENITVKELILAGGFNDLDGQLLQRPYKDTFSWGNELNIEGTVKSITCIIDPKDDKVDPELSQKLAKDLQAKVVYINSQVPHFRSCHEPDLIDFVVNTLE